MTQKSSQEELGIMLMLMRTVSVDDLLDPNTKPVDRKFESAGVCSRHDGRSVSASSVQHGVESYTPSCRIDPTFGTATILSTSLILPCPGMEDRTVTAASPRSLTHPLSLIQIGDAKSGGKYAETELEVCVKVHHVNMLCCEPGLWSW